MDRGELDSEHRRLFLAGEPAVIDERQRGELAPLQRVRQRDSDAHVRLRARRWNLLAILADHFGQAERVIELEGKRADVILRDEADQGGRADSLRRRIDFRVYQVALDIDSPALAVPVAALAAIRRALG